MQQKWIILAGCGLLAACGNGTNPFQVVEPTVFAEARTPEADGTFAEPLLAPQGEEIDGYAYQIGRTSDGIGAIAGIVPGTTVSAFPAVGPGTATFTGDYRLRTLSIADYVNGAIPANVPEQKGQLTLDVDFVNQTIVNDGGNLTVAGTFAGSDLGGTVTFDGITGDLDGLMGGTDVVGAFQGATGSRVLAGGFSASQ